MANIRLQRNADRRCNADVPGQQFGDAVDGMVGDTADHLAQIGFWIEAVELGGSISA